MPDPNDWNKAIIEEFRAHEGKVGGQFAGAPLLLITTTGARTGRRITTPLVYLPDGERMLVFASKGGAPTHPAWYYNLVAHPTVTVEVEAESGEFEAVVITGEEHDQLYARQAKAFPGFAEYQAKTKRTIPVVALRRKG